MYSFERDDNNSFSYISRLYNVYEGDDRESPVTSLVVGYDDNLDQYFVCYWSGESFNLEYGHYPDKCIETWIEVMNEFIVLFENIFDKSDIIEENHYTRERIEGMPELTREDLLYYVGSCTFDEDIDCPCVLDENDCVIDEAIQKEYLVPRYYESDEDTEMLEYDRDEFLDFAMLNEITESMYFTINFNEINK